MTAIRNVTPFELPKLLAALHLLSHPYRLGLTLMLEAGLRVEETRALKWTHLIWDEHLNTAISLTPDMTKHHRARTLPISAELAAAIKDAYYLVQDLGPRLAERPALAHKQRRQAISARQLQRTCQRIGRHILQRHLTPHMLRHTFATRLLAVSNVSVVQCALGHRRLSTTQIYLHPNADDLHQAVAAM